MLEFIPVSTDEELKELAETARDIWLGYWPSIIGMDQTRYMIDMFHSPSRMRLDMEHHGYRYWILRTENGEIAGYTGAAPEIATGDPETDNAAQHSKAAQERWGRRLFISKIYLHPQHRGKHYATQVLEFYQGLCKSENLQAMYLTVNVNNELGIRAYLGNGFEIIDKQAAQIGGGFVMDDYIMAKEI